MKMFVIELEDGDYLTSVQISSNYLDFKRTTDRTAAHQLNDLMRTFARQVELRFL
jgi:hypothetical protein